MKIKVNKDLAGLRPDLGAAAKTAFWDWYGVHQNVWLIKVRWFKIKIKTLEPLFDYLFGE